MANAPKAPSSTENLFAGITGAVAPIPPTAPAVPAVVADDEDDAPAPQMSERDMLRSRAKLMGIEHSPNIGNEALRTKIQAKMDGVVESAADETKTDEPEVKVADQTETKTETPAATTAPIAKPKSLRQSMRETELALVRLRITNLDPKKKDLPGEVFVFANRILGNVKKYVPFGEKTDNGYHVPYCIYKLMRDREFLSIKVSKNSQGQETVTSKYVREFALEILPQLTTKELATLAAAQAAAGGLDD